MTQWIGRAFISWMLFFVASANAEGSLHFSKDGNNKPPASYSVASHGLGAIGSSVEDYYRSFRFQAKYFSDVVKYLRKNPNDPSIMTGPLFPFHFRISKILKANLNARVPEVVEAFERAYKEALVSQRDGRDYRPLYFNVLQNYPDNSFRKDMLLHLAKDLKDRPEPGESDNVIQVDFRARSCQRALVKTGD